MDYFEKSLLLHKKFHGKLCTKEKVSLENSEDLSTYYSPGVAAPCLEIQKDEKKAYDYTRKGNNIAIISDGSAVLGLGNIGGLAGLPVMEGKAILFKKFGNIDAIPIVLSTQDPDEVIHIIEGIAPSFGGINLEDISAPNCFYIEKKLKEKLNIPVFHDDQHGTAIVVLAGIINALKLKGEELSNQKIIISGAGAAAIAIGHLLWKAGAKNIIFSDSKGLLSTSRKDLNPYKQEVLKYNTNNVSGTIHDGLKDSDIFIGVSKGNILNSDDIKTMNKNPIIFALANPIPEITPEEAKKGGAYIIATGRSDYPNQVNNVLAFPGIFRGALDGEIKQITDEHKLAAAYALANSVKEPEIEKILPTAFEKEVVENIATAVKNIA